MIKTRLELKSVFETGDAPTQVDFENFFDSFVHKSEQFSGAYADLSGKPTLFSGAWTDLTGKPSTFAPSAHNHSASEITSGVLAAARLGSGSATDGYMIQLVSGVPTWVVAPSGGGGSTSPSGSNGQVQFNNSGAFGASSKFFWDNTNFRLGIRATSPATAIHAGDAAVDTETALRLTSLYGSFDVKNTYGEWGVARVGSAEVIRIDSTNKVGILTTTPAYSFDVNGTARVVTVPTITTATKMLVKDPTTGQISEQLISSGGSGWLPTGNSGLSSTTHFLGNTDNIPVRFRVANTKAGDIWGDPYYHSYFGYNSGNGNNGLYHTAMGTNAFNAASAISLGCTAMGFNSFNGVSDATYGTVTGYASGRYNTGGAYNFVYGANGDVAISGSNRGNIGNVIWTNDNNGAATSSITPKGRVSIGVNNPNPRSLLELSNSGVTKGGFKLPEFTTTDRDAISWAAGDKGMLIENVTVDKTQKWNGTAWIDLH